MFIFSRSFAQVAATNPPMGILLRNAQILAHTQQFGYRIKFGARVLWGSSATSYANRCWIISNDGIHYATKRVCVCAWWLFLSPSSSVSNLPLVVILSVCFIILTLGDLFQLGQRCMCVNFYVWIRFLSSHLNCGQWGPSGLNRSSNWFWLLLLRGSSAGSLAHWLHRRVCECQRKFGVWIPPQVFAAVCV